MEDRQKTNPDPQRDRLRGFAIVRAVVAGYLVYLGGSLIYDYLGGSSTMSPAAAWGLGLLFIAAGAGFGVYAWRRWKAEENTEGDRG